MTRSSIGAASAVSIAMPLERERNSLSTATLKESNRHIAIACHYYLKWQQPRELEGKNIEENLPPSDG